MFKFVEQKLEPLNKFLQEQNGMTLEITFALAYKIFQDAESGGVENYIEELIKNPLLDKINGNDEFQSEARIIAYIGNQGIEFLDLNRT